jgi:hypothetical protein
VVGEPPVDQLHLALRPSPVVEERHPDAVEVSGAQANLAKKAPLLGPSYRRCLGPKSAPRAAGTYELCRAVAAALG